MAASGKKKGLLLVRIKRLMRRSDTKIEYKFNSLLFSFFTLIIAFGAITSFTLKGSTKLPTIAATHVVRSNEKINAEVTISGISPAAKNSIEKSRRKFIETTKPVIAQNIAEQKLKPENRVEPVIETAVSRVLDVDPAYLVKVNRPINSFSEVLPELNSAISQQLVLTPEIYQKAISYQNFKQLETMLTTTGDSIQVTEDKVSKDSYRKLITIETTDKNGDKHVYNLIVELYQ
jgi:hypothetical protein